MAGVEMFEFSKDGLLEYVTFLEDCGPEPKVQEKPKEIKKEEKEE